MSKKKSYENVPLREQIKPVFKERFTEILGENEYEKFIDYILKPQRKSFRINSIKSTDTKKTIEDIKKKGIIVKKVPWCPDAYFAEYSEDTRTDLGNLYEHFLGKIYVQEATSMCPVEVLDFPEKIPHDFKVLDMAAAPGSKTTQLGEKLYNKGLLIANELDYKRVSALKINLERSGLTNVIITINDGLRIEGENEFDKIVLDAPCSGSGVIRKSPNTIKRYNPKQLRAMQNLQLQLLRRAFGLLKKGGEMTYSTCSLDPEENELCVMKFLEEQEGARLETIKLKGLILNNKLKEFQGTKIPKEIQDKTIRIWPQDNDTNGFFLCKLKKE